MAKTMTTYSVWCDCDGERWDIEAESLEAALDAAEDKLLEYEWDEARTGGVTMTVEVTDTETGETLSRVIQIDPEESDIDEHHAEHARNGHEHAWERPHAVVGGIESNPGVWSTGRTTMIFASVCVCGAHKTEVCHGSQRNPGEADTTEIEYPDGLWPWGEDCTTPGESADEDAA